MSALTGLKGLMALTVFLSFGFFSFAQLAHGAGDPLNVKVRSAPPGQRGDPVAGKAVYERYCHYCHGRKGYGDGPVGTAITPHPADFVHDTKRMRKSDEKLFKSISDGIQRKIGGEAMAMPRWANILSEKQRWDVLAYVRELERAGRTAEGLSLNVRKGARAPVKSKER